MIARRLSLLVALITALTVVAMKPAKNLPNDSVLRRWAAATLMVGFKGNAVTDTSDAIRYVRDLHVGSLILFDIDLTGDASLGSRNITSAKQLQQLTADIRHHADYPVLIAADQEGGRVQRLKPAYGFQALPSAAYLGKLNNTDTTRHYAALAAKQLAECGVNVNLAPVVDLYFPDAVIGKQDRCISGDPAVTTQVAGEWIDQHSQQGVVCALKHFPGHGSAKADSHWLFVDVTETAQPSELEPYRALIAQGKVQMIMTAHIYNHKLDANYPATLSHNVLTGLLRNQLHYEGVIVTDDLYMEAISKKYGVEQAVVLALNAGADMLCVGNNINTGYEPERPFLLVDMIVKAVKDGRISPQRLRQAYERITRLQQTATAGRK